MKKTETATRGALDGETLAGAVRQRINERYDGNQSAFATAVGASANTINQLLQGKIKVPQPTLRRRLADELGLSHLDILVLAGVLTQEEAGVPPLVLPPDSDLRYLVTHWSELAEGARRSIAWIARQEARPPNGNGSTG